MNRDNFNKIPINLSGIGSWLIFFGVIWLLGAVGLGWLVNSFLILIAVIALSPIIAFVGFRWWLQRTLVEDGCPVCGYEFTALNKTQCKCPSCGEPILVDRGHFTRLTPSGTIEVDAVEISAKQLED